MAFAMNRATTICMLASTVVLVTSCGSSGVGPAGQSNPKPNSNIQVASGYVYSTIAPVARARELAGLPNGDLLVGTSGTQLYIVPNAESAGPPGAASVFVTLPDSPAQGVALSADGSSIYVATQYGVYKIPYHSGDQSEPNSSAVKIASVRTGAISPGSDGDVHHTSSVVATASALYVSVGSSCNACVEVDPTRATIQEMNLNGSGMHTIATRIRNAIGLAINPATGTLWAAGAGQDDLPYTHPYEYADAVTLQPGSPVDYGWPDCEENRIAYVSGANCSSVAIPRVEFPAYATHIGAVFYPASEAGTYAFPAPLRGDLFIASHGSWHCCPSTPPEVTYVPMNGDTPKTAVNWSNPNTQWAPFMWGFGTSASTNYNGRPTGIAVGSQGSLFVADDLNGVIYRIRPSSSAASALHKPH
jgi:glucose/arabinose dehydrogenase